MSLLARIEKQKAAQPEIKDNSKKIAAFKKDPYESLKTSIHKRVIEDLKDLAAPEGENSKEELSGKIERMVLELLENEESSIPRLDRLRIAKEISDDAIAFGPITSLLNDPEITEIMVNGPDKIYVERKGKIELTDLFFRNSGHVMHIIEKIVTPLGRRIDESMPMVDARLPDGSRVNAIIPPLSLKGPAITIRKFFKDPLTIDNLVEFDTLTPQIAGFLEACVKARLNILVSGGTGSGKTTTLNVLSSFIPNDERIVTIEDAAELQLRQEHVITLESRPPNIEGKGAITIRDLVRNALRMRPDRIVVGEVRSGEALDMLQAMNTGHDGSLTTGHANAPRDMLSRLETMVLMAGMDLPVKAIREQISSAIDLIIQQSRLRDGSRKITHLTEVQGMEGDIVVLQDIYVYKQEGTDPEGRQKGRFIATGIRPKFINKLEAHGINIPYEAFDPSIL
ncbi:putative conjugal transfer protein [Pelotomaculum schinkii]|uniref:Putative conjugal transfer protein n=1 Tax=Pelotomaculum schinkii TaxID=78350 RepID=A0A4Y7RDC6_9FIRM|nr:CpaF family protein [Pelotomaculum schinkii]TEB06994.1 putative conjugal transfer protein [Pelotomaculum schinkii]